MSDEICFSINKDLAEIPRLVDVIRVFLTRVWVPSAAERVIDLAIEEIVARIIKYGRNDEDLSEIRVNLSVEGDCLTADVEDDGRPFNPLNIDGAGKGTLGGYVAIGSSGLRQIHNVAERVEYQRVSGRNHVRIRIRERGA